MVRYITSLIVSLLILLGCLTPVYATNSWNGYHWARTANPFTLKLGNNTSGSWTNLLNIASSDWSQSNILDTTVVAGGTKPRNCRPTAGRNEICNANYGNNGWLGLAQIWISNGTHITQGIVKNNDYYFGSSSYKYNNTAEMQHVICQEIGHTLGLDHQSTDGSSQNTCMDYYHNINASDTLSIHPNQHDYDELAIIYGHIDLTTTIGQKIGSLPEVAQLRGDFNNPGEWGRLVRSEGREALYELDLGNGNKVFTFVIYP